MELTERLSLLTVKPDDSWQHVIITNQQLCTECTAKPCLTICPSGVFLYNAHSDDPVLVLYKQCIECGACRLVCPFDNIDFSYPKGGFGVCYREG